MGRVDLKAVQKFPVHRRGRPYYRRMESVRHRHQYRLYPHGRKHRHSVFHGFAFPGYHRLRRTVLVGYRHITGYLLKFRLYLFHGGGYSGHFAAIRHLYISHSRTARCYRLNSVGETEHPRRHRRAVFAQAVPHRHIGFNAELIKQPHHGDIGRKYRRLGYLGLLNALFPLFILLFAFAFLAPYYIRQSGAGQLFQNSVRFCKGIPNNLILAGQIFHHIHILRPLAREHKANFGFLAVVIERIYAFHL